MLRTIDSRRNLGGNRGRERGTQIGQARGRKWAPYAVSKPGPLALAIEALSVTGSDAVLDLECDLGAFRDAMAEAHPRSHVESVFSALEIPEPDPSDAVPPRHRAPRCPPRRNGWRGASKVFGTFVDRVSREEETLTLEAMDERGASGGAGSSGPCSPPAFPAAAGRP